jgi:hypothetical protein
LSIVTGKSALLHKAMRGCDVPDPIRLAPLFQGSARSFEPQVAGKFIGRHADQLARAVPIDVILFEIGGQAFPR